MIKTFTIYGERCSGTNYLEELMLTNFDIELTWKYGYKHWFGFNDLNNSDDILFIGISRNLIDWINSLYREKHQLPPELTENINTFLNNEFYSINEKSENKEEILDDRNIFTKERYKNIFELRHVKNKFLFEIMPTLVKNYCLISYDSLIKKNDKILIMLKNKYNLKVKTNINFPLNITYYKNYKEIPFIKKENEISKEEIIKKAKLFYKKKIFLKLYF
jgi:hypothetical protein